MVAAHVLEHPLQLAGHLLHTWWRHDLDADGNRLNLDLDLLVVQLSLAEHLAEFLPRVIVGAVGFADGCMSRCRRRGWQQRIQNSFLCRIFCAMADFRHFLFAGHFDSDIHQVTHDAVNFPADVAHFGELRCLDLDKGSFRELCEPPRNLGFANACRPNHQNVLRRDFAAEWFVHLDASPSITKRDGNSALCIVLANDVLVQFLNDFSGCHL